MSVVGTVQNDQDYVRGYEFDPMAPYAEAFVNVAKSGIQEGYNYLRAPHDFLQNPATRDEMKKFFMENTFDPNDPRYCTEGKNANPLASRNIQERAEDFAALFDNDIREGIMKTQWISEASPLSAYNNVVGMTLPMHKQILMNATFDQVLPKKVSKSNRFTLTMETREIVDIHGNRFDMFYEQNMMTPAINESIPQADIIIALPEIRTTNILKDTFQLQGRKYNLSVKSCVTGIIAESYVEEGEMYYDSTAQEMKTVTAGNAGVKPTLFRCGDIQFHPAYGELDAVMNVPVRFMVKKDAVSDPVMAEGILNGVRWKDNMFQFSFTPGNTDTVVSAILFHAVCDASSAAFPTVSFDWHATTKEYQIPDQPHITVTVTPESVKDIQASYDVNQITKLMSMMQLGLLHWKDDNILSDLDHSFETMPDSQKVSAAIDWAPPMQFNGTPRQWRRDMFMEQLDRYVTRMLQVLNDENMTVLVFGRPDVIGNIVPQEFTYQSPSNIGPVELDFTRTVVTSNRRTYNFVSSQKLRNDNNLILLLIPRNTLRITYCIIDYQLYVSNELRDPIHIEAPAMTCFERWYFLQYQPVQGRIMCLNTMGTREQMENPNPVASRAMHDDTANFNTYASSVNGVSIARGNGTYGGVAVATAVGTQDAKVINPGDTAGNAPFNGPDMAPIGG